MRAELRARVTRRLVFGARPVSDNRAHSSPTFLPDDQRQVAVVDEDAFADLDDLDDVLVVQPEHVLRARLGVLVVNGHRDRLARVYLYFRVNALHSTTIARKLNVNLIIKKSINNATTDLFQISPGSVDICDNGGRNTCLAVWCSGNALVSINAVALHRARLVLGWVTAFRQVNCLIT